MSEPIKFSLEDLKAMRDYNRNECAALVDVHIKFPSKETGDRINKLNYEYFVILEAIRKS